MKDGKTCEICNKTFTRRNYLQKHMEKLHSKKYSCPICSRYFDGPTDHSCATADGRYACYVESCKLKFANGMCLRLHIRDAHKKIEEDIASGANLKTKKAARDMVKTLCKKINVLSKCFDELRYQMNNITDFLKKIGYEDYVDFVQDGIIEEVSVADDDDDDDVEVDDGEDDDDVDDEMAVDECELLANARDIESVNNGVVTMFPPCWSPIEVVNEASEDAATINTVEHKVEETLPIINLPAGTKITPTAIKNGPFKILPLRGKIIKTATSATATSSSASILNNDANSLKSTTTTTAPPLFLNIQYDTEAEISKTDPKITFHFDTRPLDNNRLDESAEDFILPT